MATTFLLATFAALAQAHVIPILSVRDPIANTTAPAPAGGNSTYTYPGFDSPSDPAYKHSAAWKVYLAFLIIGIAVAVFLPALGAWLWWSLTRRSKNRKEPKEDVEMSRMSKLKTRGMVEGLMPPRNAHVPRERSA
jgi:hypothetical protein